MKKVVKPKAPKEIKISYEPGIKIFESGDYKPGKMVFKLGDKEFCLEEKIACSLFGRTMQIKFEHLRGEDESMGELNTLENYVKVMRLMKKGLTIDQVARILGYSHKKVRAFIGIVQRKRNYFSSTKYEEEWNHQSAEEDYVKVKITGREEPGKEPGRKFIDLLVLRGDLRKGLSNKRIAELFEVDEKSFNEFMEKNQKYLDLLM